ncbi:protein kinase [Candidatus Uabimicrobium sp. HlEnr_7]|uniref:protein kinase domain-containing protein n=1 Tax=Candidatus Uabimicrobium helgolandensis TaxID=3095367 RepID=UPI0035591E39
MSDVHDEVTTVIPGGADLKTGQIFSHYQIYQVLGRGGMGVVYKAYDTRLQRTIALKILNGSQSQQDRISLLKETQILASLDHKNIVKIYDVGTTPSYHFTMEYIEGHTLHDLIANNSISIEQSMRFLASVANALHYVHKENIIHRDIKPGNIMVTKEKVVKLMDFGIAKTLSENKSQDDVIIGTPAYCSAEQLKGRPEKVSDIYSLGVVFYECITGHRPFNAHDHWELMLKIGSNDFITPRQYDSNISRYVEAICLKCMRKSRKNRYSSAKALERDLLNQLAGKPIIAKPSTNAQRLYKYIVRNKILCCVFTGFILLSLSWIYIIYQKMEYSEERLGYLQKIEAEKKQLQKVTNIIFDSLNYMTKQHSKVFADPIFSSKMIEVFHQDLDTQLNYNRLITVRSLILSSSNKPEDLEQSLKDFTYYLEKNPKSADRYNSRGMVFRKLKRYKKAIDDYNSAIKIRPRYTYFFNRGVTYDVLGQWKKAIEDYTVSIKYNPYYFIAYASRGLIYEKQQKYSLAIRDYQKALQLKIPKGLGSGIKKEMAQKVKELQNK